MTSMAIEHDLVLPMRGGVHLFANLCCGWAHSASYKPRRKMLSWCVVGYRLLITEVTRYDRHFDHKRAIRGCGVLWFLLYRRLLGSWLTPSADDSSLVAQRLPIQGENSPSHHLSRIWNEKRPLRNVTRAGAPITSEGRVAV